MKLTRQEILDNNFKILNKTQNKLVKYPEEVDTDAGTLSFWIVPITPIEVISALHQPVEMEKEPPEVDMILKQVTGIKIAVLDAHEKVIAETQ